MKAQLVFIVILTALPLSGCAGESAKKLKRYSIESGMIEYDISGGGERMGHKIKTHGKKTFYFKNYGTLSIEEEQSISKQAGAETKRHTIKKNNNISIYHVDFINKKIIKSVDLIAEACLKSRIDLSEYSQKQLAKMGAKKIGVDMVLGYRCDIWDTVEDKQCLYKDQIPLWIEATNLGLKIKIMAIKVDFDVVVPDEKFSLPKFSITTQ